VTSWNLTPARGQSSNTLTKLANPSDRAAIPQGYRDAPTDPGEAA
jgi:hypothetical protein